MENRIVIISEMFYPSTTTTAHILTDVADGLVRRFDVEVITTSSLYDIREEEFREETSEEKTYPIHRIKGKGYDKNHILSRIFGLFSTSLKLGWKIVRNVRKTDRVLIVTNPAPLLLLVSLLRKFKPFNLTVLVHDVFPENTLAAGLIKSESNIFYRVSRKIFNKAYLSADNLVVLGRDMADVVAKKVGHGKNAPTITIIENWADSIPDSEFRESAQGDNDSLRVLYAGNIGRVQGLEYFIDIICEADNPALSFTIRGDGAKAREIRTKVESLPRSGIEFADKFTRKEQLEILLNCDIALVILTKGMYGLGVPSKSYNIMEAGKPILFIGDLNSEIARMVRENDIGYCFDIEDRQGIKEWLSGLGAHSKQEFRLKGERARKLSKTTYSKECGIEKFNRLFSGE